MRTSFVAVFIALAAACTPQRPANDGWATTSAAPNDNYGSPTMATVYSGTSAPTTPDPSAYDPPASAEPAASDSDAREARGDRIAASRFGEETSGSRDGEAKITSEIRDAMMASKTLSPEAKNAKITTTGTKVTLRGTVKSRAERSEIESLARSVQGVTEIDDQLVIDEK